MAKALKGRPLVIRVFDIGGDKKDRIFSLTIPIPGISMRSAPSSIRLSDAALSVFSSATRDPRTRSSRDLAGQRTLEKSISSFRWFPIFLSCGSSGKKWTEILGRLPSKRDQDGQAHPDRLHDRSALHRHHVRCHC